MSCKNSNPPACPPPPEPVSADNMSDVSDMLDAMDAKAHCYTDKSLDSTSALVIVGPAAGSGSSVSQNDISNGCEKMQAVAQAYKVAQRNISCIINRSCNLSSETIDAEQATKIKCDGDIVINKINQNQSVKLVSEIKLTEEEESKIESEMKSVNKQVSEMLTDTKNGYLGSQEGGKQASSTTSVVDNMDYKSKIRDKISDFNKAVKARQYIDIEGKAKCVVLGEINQTQQIELLAKSMIASSLKENFKTVMETVNEQDSKAVAKSAESNQKTFRYLIIGVVVFLVVMVIGFILYKVFSKKADVAQQGFQMGNQMGNQMVGMAGQFQQQYSNPSSSQYASPSSVSSSPSIRR